MNANEMNKWLSLVANLGVIAGIFFLAYEIRQSNQVAVSSNDIALRGNTASLNESVYGNPQLAELVFRARDPDAEFDGAEREIMGAFVARLFNWWGSVERAHRSGLASADSLEGALDDVRWAVDTYPGLNDFYKDMVAAYPAYEDSVIYRTVRERLEGE